MYSIYSDTLSNLTRPTRVIIAVIMAFKKKYFYKLFWLFAGVSSSSSCFEEAQWQVQWDVYQRSGGHLQKERKSLDLNWGKWSCVQCCDVITMFMSSSLVLYMHGFKGVLGTISKCDTCNFNKFVFNLRCYFMRWNFPS